MIWSTCIWTCWTTCRTADVAVAGFGFGGWIAAELAVAGHPRLQRLILVDPVGIKIGGREDRDIVHMFNTNPTELNRRSWHDPAARPPGIYGLGWQATISDEHDRRRDDHPGAQLGLAVPVCLAPAHVQSATETLAAPHQRPDTGAVGRERPYRHAGLRPSLRQPDPGRGVRNDPPAGHHPELEQPAAFVASVERFLP